MSQTGATLSGSASGVAGTIVESGFEWGLSSASMPGTCVSNDGSSTAFTAALSGLTKETTYYFRAYTTVQGTGEYSGTTRTFYGSVRSFITSESMAAAGYLELPARQSGGNLFYDNFGTGSNRNYSYCYDKGLYASLWTAYPLTYAHTQGSGHTSSWRWNPNLPQSQQVNIVTGAYEKNYGNGTYSRGHLCPNADRKSDDAMNAQTFYPTNQVPQIQNSFNSGIWSNLENAIRNLTTSTDTIYVVTGPCYRKQGGNETISYLTANSGVSPAKVPVPNYFYKVLLKVKRSGNTVTSASAVGFWFEHKTYSGGDYTAYAVSVDQIEQFTGIDFFVNLPDNIESAAEQNTSWKSFSDF